MRQWLLPAAAAIAGVGLVIGVAWFLGRERSLAVEWVFGERIVLPTDEYMPLYTDARGVRYESAIDNALAACATERGLELAAPDREGARRDVHAHRYGVVDAAQAGEWGYQLPPDPIAEAVGEYSRELTPEQHEVIGSPEDSSSCTAAVQRAVGVQGDPRWGDLQAVVDLQLASFRHAESHPEVREANRRWSACLRDATGVALSTVIDAVLAASADEFGAREVEVALADIRCKESSGVVGTYIAAETEFQADIMGENPQVFERALDLQMELFAWAGA